MQINPVLEKELKVKMRGWRAPTLITVYMGFLGLIVFLIFLGNRLLSPYSMSQFNPSVALNAYNTLAIFQLLLLIFIVPSMTGGAISGERERQTLDLLLCTNLSTFKVVTGKMLVSIAHIMLLITASLPIMGTVFLYGGIRITDLLLLFGFYLVTAIMLGSMGIFYSSVFRKSSVAMIVSYITVLILLFGTVIVFGIWSNYYTQINQKPPELVQAMYFLFANPFFGFGSVTEGMTMGMPFFGDLFRFSMMGQYGGMQAATPPTLWGIELKPWMVNVAFDLVLSIIFILISAIKIKPVKRFRLHRRVRDRAKAEVEVKAKTEAEAEV